MRRISALLLLALAALAGVAAAPPRSPRLDLNGDPLPDRAVARLGTVRFQPLDVTGGGPAARWRWLARAVSVALSPDGKTLVVATGDGGSTNVAFMDASTGKVVRKLRLSDAAHKVQFTPDGKRLAFCGWSGVKIVDARTGEAVRTIQVDRDWDGAFAFTPDGKWAAAQPQKFVKHAPVKVWAVGTGKEVDSLPGRGASCKGLGFGPGGKRLLVWSLVPSRVTKDSVGFDSDSKAALACVDVGARKVVGEVEVNSDQFVALSPDGETVAVDAVDHASVRLRHLPSAAERSLTVRPSRFAFTPDGKALVVIDEDGKTALWDVKTTKKVRDLDGAMTHRDVEIVGVSKDGKTVAALDGGWHSLPRIVVWDGATGKRAARPAGHDGTVTCIAFAPDGKTLVSGSIDKTVRLWDPRTGKHLRILTTHKDAVRSVAVSADGKLVASSCRDGATRVTSAADGKAVAAFVGPAKGATALAFSADGKVLFMGCGTAEVLGRIADGKEVLHLPTDGGAVLALGGGGALALTVSDNVRDESTPERLQVWDVSARRQTVSLSIRGDDRDASSVRCDAAVFSGCGRFFAASQVSTYEGVRPSYGNSQLRLWERSSGKPIRTLGPIITKTLAFSPNGRFLAAGGAGRSGHRAVGYGSGIDVWDALTGEKADSFAVTPECIAFSPDNLRLATGGRDHCVTIWETPKDGRAYREKPPWAKELEAWWAALGGDAAGAYKAVGEMATAPEHAVALIAKRVRPVKACEPAVAAKLIAQLDSDDPDMRESAEQALEKMGESVAHFLAKALQGEPSAELRRRAKRLLSKSNQDSVAGRQRHRAVVALEWIGTPAACTLLRRLADGAPGARLTIDARAAVKRLGR
jgi:WD40 repeat protein